MLINGMTPKELVLEKPEYIFNYRKLCTDY